jgi:hypothetical protein
MTASSDRDSNGDRLLGWAMHSFNGSEYGGGRWRPRSEPWKFLGGVMTYWHEESDLFIWRRKPKMIHERTGMYSHHWALETWWLKEKDFPFKEDDLFDFEGHTSGNISL